MTDKEKAVVMAYTGIAMLTGDKFDIFHEYVVIYEGVPVSRLKAATWNYCPNCGSDNRREPEA